MREKTNEEIPNTSDKSISDFEKFKYYVELAKWFIVSVVIVVMTIIIDTGFKDRAAGMQELKEYDRYVTEKIVLNSNVASRRLLAQYYSTVTPSKNLRCGWKDYYNLLDAEYQQTFNKIDSTKKVNDSLSVLLTAKIRSTQERQIIESKIASNEILVNNYSAELSHDIVPPSSMLADDWGIVAGGYGSLEDAQKASAALQGYNLSILFYKKHNMFRIIIGPYPTQVIAQTDILRIKMAMKVTPYIVRLSKWCPNAKMDKSNTFVECQ